MVFPIATILVVLSLLKTGYFLTCFDCDGGPQSYCGQLLPPGMDVSCSQRSTQCYEAFIMYQNGALGIVERRCFEPNGNATDFCASFKSKTGRLLSCKSCTGDHCNGHQFNVNWSLESNPTYFTSRNLYDSHAYVF
ncbi:uncharacterized protein LOC132706599 [Cylas formicarius]|uniref:uncharacterized protein LOC132706599 n=1 Tax=Cylas formicarius TaxID=197179 RepID=UPI002958AF2D|nr:uncharacterized protein LOC132706599 [Cylas formicarius]